eukprot:m.56985 g.56985  ORF g.56985 m.56985 type:complete len:235 (+) comp22327_c0_seq2:161-865(+)
MADDDFSDLFARTGAGDIIRNALRVLVEHRPLNPIDVLIEHFQSLNNSVHPVTAAFRIIRLAKGHPRLVTQHVADAYTAIASDTGLRGLEFTELVGMLCVDFSPRASDVILKIFRKHEYEAVAFTEFNTAVTTCIFYEEFLRGAERLFGSLDPAQTGFASKDLCESLLKMLAETATFSFHSGHMPASPSDTDVTQHVRTMLDAKAGAQVKLSTFVQSASSLFLKILITFGSVQK